MKIKTTKKAILSIYPVIIKAGYCDLQDLLCMDTPDYYTCGVYGWNADVYSVKNGVAICTGYRPFGGVTVDHDTLLRYEKRAHKARRDLWNPDELKTYLHSLQAEFLREVLK